jgi:hypothetical protein
MTWVKLSYSELNERTPLVAESLFPPWSQFKARGVACRVILVKEA